jgi:hypothetical protein
VIVADVAWTRTHAGSVTRGSYSARMLMPKVVMGMMRKLVHCASVVLRIDDSFHAKSVYTRAEGLLSLKAFHSKACLEPADTQSSCCAVCAGVQVATKEQQVKLIEVGALAKVSRFCACDRPYICLHPHTCSRP